MELTIINILHSFLNKFDGLYKNSKISNLVLQELIDRTKRKEKTTKDNPIFVDLDGTYFK